VTPKSNLKISKTITYGVQTLQPKPKMQNLTFGPFHLGGGPFPRIVGVAPPKGGENTIYCAILVQQINAVVVATKMAGTHSFLGQIESNNLQSS
jgi:hypothetical protein